MKRGIGICLIICLLVIGGCSQGEDRSDIVEMEPQSSQMKAICELATMECYFHNVAKFREEDASGFLWWKKDKSFWIEYSGVVTIGIDASSLMIEVVDEQVTITIPQAKVLSSKVDEDTLTIESFYIDNDSASIEGVDETAAFKEAQANMTRKAENDTALLASAGRGGAWLFRSIFFWDLTCRLN